MPEDESVGHLFQVLDTTNETKVFVADLFPLVYNPRALRRADITMAFGFLEEITFPDDFRLQMPSKIRHQYFCVNPRERILTSLISINRTMFNALDANHNILLYGRDPHILTLVLVGFMLFMHKRTPLSMPQTQPSWTLTFLEVIQQSYPLAELPLEWMEYLYSYENHQTLFFAF